MAKAVKRAGAARKSRTPRLGKAFILGGLLLFGTIFGAGTLVLRSGSLWPGEYDHGLFVFNTALYGGSENHLVVMVSDRENKPLADEPVTITMTNTSGVLTLFSGKTGPSGILQADVFVPVQPSNRTSGDYYSPDNVVNITVSAAGQSVDRSLDVYNQPSYNGAFEGTATASGSASQGGTTVTPVSASPSRLYLTMDKPRYQPGQTIHLRTLSFREGAAITEPVTYVVTDPSGNKLYRKTVPADRFGITSVDYPISDLLALGDYDISVNTTQNLQTKLVPIERYVLPKFAVDFTGLRSWYTLDEQVAAGLNVSYFFGKSVDGDARISARLYSETYGWFVYQTDRYDRVIMDHNVSVSGGTANFTIPAGKTFLPSSNVNMWNQYMMDISAEVTDSAGHLEKKNATVTLSTEPFFFSAIMETPTPGQPFTATVVVRDPVGQPVAGAKVEALLKDQKVLASRDTDGRGLAGLSFTYDFQSQFIISVTAENGTAARSETYYIGSPSAIKVVPDKRFYEVGDTAHVTILADPNDDSGGVAGTALVDVLSSGVPVVEKQLVLNDHRASLSFKVDEGMLPTMEIQARKLSAMSYSYYGHNGNGGADYFQDRYTMAQDRAAVGVGITSQLNVTVQASKTDIKPGDEVDLLFRTLNGTSPVSAALAVAIVDEALLSMGGGNAFDEIRSDLQQDPGYQQYSIYSYIWGGDVSVKRAVPLFSTSDFYDYKPDTGMLSYSSTSKIGTRASSQASPDSVSRLSLGMALFGVLGYFGVLGLGIKYKRTGVALLASLLLLAAVVPAGMELSSKPKVVSFTDTGQPLSFTQYTENLGAPSYDESVDWGINGGGVGVLPPVVPAKGGASRTLGPSGSAALTDGASLSSDSTGFVTPQKAVTVRSWFPELWYWNPLVVTGDDGEARITLRAPDSIATWRIDTLASTVDGRIGVGDGSMTVFQPFFVDPDLPTSVVRNDMFAFKVAIYNYEDSAKSVTVRLLPSDWFDIVGSGTLIASSAANSVSSVSFTIRARNVGVQNLTVSGSTDEREDIVTRQVNVEPDGKLVEDIRNGMLLNDSAATLLFTLDPGRIAGSENAYLKLQSSLESIIVDGADGFINQVSGCGEQSTSGLSVDILAYQNYKKGNTDPANLSRYEDLINMGIQHEAQYISTNTGGHGRAIVWHAGLGTGEDPDIWLTAWAVQVYKDLRDAGFTVDDKIIPDLQQYLVYAQGTDGSWEFPDIGHWSINPELESYRVAATAYIIRALAISGMSPDSEAIRSGVNFIEPLIGKYNESFTMALTLDALELAHGNSSVTGPLAARLASAAQSEGNGAVSWKYGQKDDWVGRYHRGDNTIETTGYAVMALARAGADPSIVQAGAKYLVLSRGAGGFYGSTHNTAVAFSALNSLSEISPLKAVTVDVLVDGVTVDTVQLDQMNKDLTFLTDLRPWFVSTPGNTVARTVNVTLRSAGEGGVFYHLYTKQNIEWALTSPQPLPDLSFSVAYSKTNASVGEPVSASAQVSYEGRASEVRMVLVDLRAPTGFVLDENDFVGLLAGDRISFYEFLGGGEVRVYLDGLRQGETRTLDYTLTAMGASASLLQHVDAYDMYNTSLKVELAPVAFTSV